MNDRILTAQGKTGRVIAVRLLPGTDFMRGLARACEEQKMNNGIILSAIGSLKKTVFLDPVERPDMKAGYGYGEPLTADGPIELLAATGFVCHADDGKVLLHVHATMCLEDGKAFGGHLTDEGNEVLLTADIVLMEIDGVDMARKMDDEVGMLMFSPRQL